MRILPINRGVYAKQFLISPRDLVCVKHLDLYGVANNHVMQHGESAYREMLWYLGDHGVQYVGSLERKSTTFFHEGKKVGIMALVNVLKISLNVHYTGVYQNTSRSKVN